MKKSELSQSNINAPVCVVEVQQWYVLASAANAAFAVLNSRSNCHRLLSTFVHPGNNQTHNRSKGKSWCLKTHQTR